MQPVHSFNINNTFKWLKIGPLSTLGVMPQRPKDPKDPHSPYAPYMRVLDALTADIKAGTYEPGDPIPSETELCEAHGVARGTARRAVRELRERGLVVTEWGKGTFVAERGDQKR